MGEKNLTDSVTRAAVIKLVQSLSSEEKKLLLDWSERAIAIRNDSSMDMPSKIKALSKVEHIKSIKIVLQKFLLLVKEHTWTNQSWARRLGLAGVVAGTTIGGGVGIASMGFGIGAPMFLVTTAGGLALGVLVDEIKKEVARE